MFIDHGNTSNHYGIPGSFRIHADALVDRGLEKARTTAYLWNQHRQYEVSVHMHADGGLSCSYAIETEGEYRLEVPLLPNPKTFKSAFLSAFCIFFGGCHYGVGGAM